MSGSDDPTVGIWDLDNGIPISEALSRHAREDESVAMKTGHAICP